MCQFSIILRVVSQVAVSEKTKNSVSKKERQLGELVNEIKKMRPNNIDPKIQIQIDFPIERMGKDSF